MYWPIQGGGHEIDLFLLISGTLSFQALIKLITMWTLCVWLGHIGKYHLHSSKLGFNTDLEPAALGPYWTPISQNSDGISQYVLARRTVFYHYYTDFVFWLQILFNSFLVNCNRAKWNKKWARKQIWEFRHSKDRFLCFGKIVHFSVENRPSF